MESRKLKYNCMKENAKSPREKDLTKYPTEGEGSNGRHISQQQETRCYKSALEIRIIV